MGMFDYVKFAAPCWNCGALIDRAWQSKGGPCQFEELEPWEVRVFYNECICGAWNQYRVILDGLVPPKPAVPYHVELDESAKRVITPRSSADPER